MRKKAWRVKDLSTNLEDSFWLKLDHALRKKQKNSFENYIFDGNESSELEELRYKVGLLEKRLESLERKLVKSNMEEYKNWKEIEELELKEIIIRGFQLLKEGKIKLDLH